MVNKDFYVEVTSADLSGLLGEILNSNIPIRDVKNKDILTMTMRVGSNHYTPFLKILNRRGDQHKLIRQYGVGTQIKRFLKRPVVLVYILVLFFLSLYVPQHIYFIEVTGNDTVPAGYIKEIASVCGLNFGMKRKNIRSTKVKNALLERVPQLQWAGVNTKGCIATIHVREKPEEAQITDMNRISSIVASQDGVIRDITVLQGNALCSSGQAVKQGQVLISGYTDCGICIRAVQARGEVYAQTKHRLSTVHPVPDVTHPIKGNTKTYYSLKLGKKLINFYKCSGIPHTGCDKMYKEKFLTLPGGFELPVSFLRKYVTVYETEGTLNAAVKSNDWIKEYSQAYLLEHMTAGEIISSQCDYSDDGSVYRLDAQFSCIEMIGKSINEESMHKDGENN